MRVVVTGARGGLGRALLARTPPDHDAVPLSHHELPVEDAQAVPERIGAARPDVVLHLAAKTSVDGCEADPAGAAVVNALGTANVAVAAQRAGALLVAMSTDYVFDGEKGEPYDERDEPNPLSAYGRSKLAGERAARAIASDHLVVRTSWVFGAEDEFVRRSVAWLAAGEEVGGIVDQVGTPTYVAHLAERLWGLVGSAVRGTVHLAGPEATTWYDLLVRAKELGDLPGEVVEQKAADLDRAAPRPANSALASVVLPEAGIPALPPLYEALREVIDAVR
ncbi:MAG: dTDP-4-dehydrorhamnose reductase [Actinomycetota bacterium]